MDIILNIIKKPSQSLAIALFIVSVSHVVHSQESGRQCSIEQDGVEVPIDCPIFNPRTEALTELDKQTSLLQFSNFEKSDVAQQAKQAADDFPSKPRGEYASSYSLEVRTKAVHFEKGKYIVQITFFNDADYPRKSTRHGYYSTEINGVVFQDQPYTEQWDEIVSTQLVGEDYIKYQPSIKSITDDFVNMTVLLDDSKQLENIIDGKLVKSLYHAGMPTPQYEEIKTSTSNYK